MIGVWSETIEMPWSAKILRMVFALSCFLSITLPVSATPLSDLAQSMDPGWAKLNTDNFTRSGVYRTLAMGKQFGEDFYDCCYSG